METRIIRKLLMGLVSEVIETYEKVRNHNFI